MIEITNRGDAPVIVHGREGSHLLSPQGGRDTFEVPVHIELAEENLRRRSLGEERNVRNTASEERQREGGIALTSIGHPQRDMTEPEWAHFLRTMIAGVEGLVEGDVFTGAPKSYFELPVPNGGSIRCVYRTWILTASTAVDAIRGIVHILRGQIEERTSLSSGSTPVLFWRLKDKIEVGQKEDGDWSARTRVAFLPE